MFYLTKEQLLLIELMSDYQLNKFIFNTSESIVNIRKELKSENLSIRERKTKEEVLKYSLELLDHYQLEVERRRNKILVRKEYL